QVAIIIGLLCGWSWARNPWLRWTHMLLIAAVALEGIFDITCPFTTWERQLRAAAGQNPDQEVSFIGGWLRYWAFCDTAEEWQLNLGYIVFALVVIVTFCLAPPRRRRKPTPEQPLPAMV